MTYIASITSQGQLTIPKQLRDKYGIISQAKAFITDLGNGFIIKTYTENDFLNLKGALKNNSTVRRNKIKPLQEIIDQENRAIQNAIATNASAQ